MVLICSFNFLKMKKLVIFILSYWLLLGSLIGQADQPAIQSPADHLFQPVVSIPVTAKLIATDKLQQLYVVTASNELIKYSAEGVEAFRYNDNSLGELKTIDVTDPFNLLLYYPEYLTVTTLDRTLSKTGDYLLYDLDVTDVQAVGMSNDNNVWLYDDTSFKLKKINRAGETLAESNDLSMLLNDSPAPNFITERNNWVYVNAPQSGILVFDNFGQYVKQIPIAGLQQFSIVDDRLLYLCEQSLCSFHLKSLLGTRYSLPRMVPDAGRISFQRNKLFVAYADRVEVYALLSMKKGEKQ